MDIGLDFLNTFIRGDSLILIPTLYILYLLLSKTPRVPNWSIPWVLLFVASLSCFLYYGWEIQSFVQAVLVTGAATLSKDLIHRPITAYNESKNKDE